MSRFLRWLSYFFGLVLLIIVIGYITAQVYRPKILETLNNELKAGVHGDFHIGGLDFTIFEQFPRFSIAISDVYLRGPKYDTYHKDFFHADKIYVHIKLGYLLRGTLNLNAISVRNGDIFIFRTKGNYSNSDVFKKKEKVDSADTGGSALSMQLGTILFENTRFTFVDSLKRKSYDVRFDKTIATFTSTDSSRYIALNGPMWFGGLTFNQDKGGYLPDARTLASLNLELITGAQRMMVHPSSLTFAKSKVDLKGEFAFKSPGTFSLHIHSDAIDYGEGLTLITRALNEKLSKFHFKTPLKLDVNLIGSLAGGAEPEIDIDFSTANNRFASGKISLDDLTMSGSFTNHFDSTKNRDDYNSRVFLDTLSAKVAGIPTHARFSIFNLKDPELDLLSSSSVNLIDLNQNTDTTVLKFLSGKLQANVEYKGRLMEYLDKTSTSYTGKLLGDIVVTDGSVQIVAKQRKVDQMNVKIHFTEEHMDLDKVEVRVNGNAIKVNGIVDGFIPFFFEPEEKGFVRLSVYSPRLDLATLIKKKSKVKPKASPKGPKGISNLIDVLDNKVEFVFDMKIDEIVNGPFHASRFSGKMKLIKDQFSADPIRLKVAGGDVQVSIKMANLNQDVNPVIIKADIRNADIRELFVAFNNFSQSTIKSDNISGKISTTVELKAQMDEQFKLVMPSMDGAVNLKVKDGDLKDFEPLQNLSNFLFKKRDFSEVKFAEIIGNFGIMGPTIDIGRMEIQSSVLTLFLQGKYSLKDSTDLSIQVPLSNLKKRDKAYKPENVGVDAKVGPSVFLRAHKNKEGKMVISYDPLKKFKRK